MTEVTIKGKNEEDLVSFEKPEKLTVKTVAHWSRHFQDLKDKDGSATIMSKAKNFLKNNCIRYDHELKCFFCDPINGYNKSIYTIRSVKGNFTCSCQFFNRVCEDKKDVNEGVYICSHILALYLWLKMKHWNEKEQLLNGNKI
jgi:hypothetical protein